MKALVIGGTGPTGPPLVNGLLEQGWDVAILHTGRHETDEVPPHVEHVHCDPFQVADVAAALGDRTFDLVYAMYGRLRDTAPFFRGRCGRFLAVGGVPVYRGYVPGPSSPLGMVVPVREEDERAVDDDNVKVARIVRSEDALFEAHPDATLFRYPHIYGPRQIVPREWVVVRRILDGRRRIIVADGGLTLRAAGYTDNVGHALALAAGHLDVVAGRAYNVGDEHTLTARQGIEVIAAALGVEVEIVSLPAELATPARPFLASATTAHTMVDVDAIRRDLGYRDVLPVVEALSRTATMLAADPVERASKTEMRLQDPFDYEAEDRLVEAYRAGIGAAVAEAEAYDPGYRDRYAPGSDDWRLVAPRN